MNLRKLRKLATSRAPLTLAKVLFAMACSMPFAQHVSAHGYTTSPASRAYLCSTGVNTGCGAIQWEPQSTEALKGFPQAGPADGHIASAGGKFPEMDAQSTNRWHKVAMHVGLTTFTWKLTAAHATDKWKYYITKPGWDSNSPLGRSDFDLTPFCVINYNGQQPPFDVSHQCNVPTRHGYHVILAVWVVADTANAFYHVIDADFGGGDTPPPPDDGDDTPPPPDDGGDNPPPSGGQCAGVPAWSPTTVYHGGDKVTFASNIYQANWWTRGANPADHSGAYDEWSLVGACSDDGGDTPPDGGDNPPPGDDNPPPDDGGDNPPPDDGGDNPPPDDGNDNPPPDTNSAHLMIGYWHNFDNGSGLIRIADVPNVWDVIVVAFAADAGNGSVAFNLDPGLDKQQFIADIAAKQAQGKKVLLSFGGQNGTVTLNNAQNVTHFVNSTAALINEYGFDGIDIDLESGAGVTSGAPIQTYLVQAVKQLEQQFPGLFVSMAPEFPYVQGGYVAYAGIWGAYLPIINGLRDELDVLQVQLYNNGGLYSPYQPGAIPAATEDMLVASVKMLVEGFPLHYGNAGQFAPLPASKVALGLPSGPSAAGSGYTSPQVVNAAIDCITTDTNCDYVHMTQPQPDFRGVMSWSINWDKHDGQGFSTTVGNKVHSLP